MPFPPDVVNRSHAQDLCHFVVIAIAIGLLHPLGTDVVRSQAVRYPHRLDSIGEAQKVVDFRVIGPQSLMAAHHPAIGSSGAKLLGMRRRQPATKRLRNTGIVNDDREPLLTTPAWVCPPPSPTTRLPSGPATADCGTTPHTTPATNTTTADTNAHQRRRFIKLLPCQQLKSTSPVTEEE